MTNLERPIIFIGVPRSGTTIISEIIFQHEDLAWPSNYQDKFPNKIGVNRIRPILDNRLWRLKGQKKQLNKVSIFNKYAFRPVEAYSFWRRITPVNFDFSKDFLLDVKAKPEEKKYIRDVFGRMVKYQKRRRLAFKITGPGRISYLHSIFPDAIFIEITREPYANIRSLLKVPFWKERGMFKLWWTGAYTEKEISQVYKWKDKPALITALQYKKIRAKTKEEIEQYKVNHLIVSYEDFIQNPKKQIDKILDKTRLNKSQYIDNYLKQNKIYNRNIDCKKYFSQQETKEIESLLQTK